jgi:hypothetical protein
VRFRDLSKNECEKVLSIASDYILNMTEEREILKIALRLFYEINPKEIESKIKKIEEFIEENF